MEGKNNINSNQTQFDNVVSILTFISIASDFASAIIIITIMITVIYHCYSTRLSDEDKTIIFISTTIYPFIFLFIIVVTSFHIQTFLGQHYGFNFESPFCIFMGCLPGQIIGMLSFILINQVIYIVLLF